MLAEATPQQWQNIDGVLSVIHIDSRSPASQAYILSAPDSLPGGHVKQEPAVEVKTEEPEGAVCVVDSPPKQASSASSCLAVAAACDSLEYDTSGWAVMPSFEDHFDLSQQLADSSNVPRDFDCVAWAPCHQVTEDSSVHEVWDSSEVQDALREQPLPAGWHAISKEAKAAKADHQAQKVQQKKAQKKVPQKQAQQKQVQQKQAQVKKASTEKATKKASDDGDLNKRFLKQAATFAHDLQCATTEP